jgi:hypothetical protein
MNELTDLEICQRIAQIEGIQNQIEQADTQHPYIYSEELNAEYNPLTDNSLCFSLMLRHEVSLTYGEYAVNAEILIEKEDGEHSFATQAYCPKRAICLAIVASKVGL